MLRTGLALFLVLHGLVHVGLAVAPRPEQQPAAMWSFFTTDSWLLASSGAATMRAIGLALVAAATVSFVGAGVGLLAHQGWWRGAAVGAALLSLLLLSLFWHRYLVLGVALDAAILAALILAHWPAATLVGA